MTGISNTFAQRLVVAARRLRWPGAFVRTLIPGAAPAADATAEPVALPGLTSNDPNIPSYVTFDVRPAWRPTTDLELASVGQNLAGSNHEFNPTFIPTSATDAGPSGYAKLTWKF